MSFDVASRGGKRYGAGRRLLSPASFLKSSENREKTKKKWSQQHGRIYIKKSIHETWKRLKGSCLYSSDTAFAQHLLSLEMRRRARITVKVAKGKSRDVNDLGDETGHNKSVITSTPLKRRVDYAPEIEESPIIIQETSCDEDVNITGSTFHISEPSSDESSVDDSSSSASDESDSDDEVDFNDSVLSDALKELDEDRDEETSSSSEDEEDELFMEQADTGSDEDQNVEFELSGYLEDPLVDSGSDVSDENQNEMAEVESRKKGLTARKQLAVIDWNYHMDTKVAVNSYGEESVSRKYNQRTKTWNVKVLKEDKDYQYIWMLLARIFRLRSEDDDGVLRSVSMDADDPRRIAPTIAEAPPVPSRELYERHNSRFPKAM